MKTYSVDEVANTLISLARESFIDISNLKLQKLMYYAQAWNLVFHGTPLFDEDCEAWVHGPVIPSLFRRFRDYKWNPITENVSACGDGELLGHLSEILRVYGKFSPNELERLSHSERPWRDARGTLPPDAPSRVTIPKPSMKDFYIRLAHAQTR